MSQSNPVAPINQTARAEARIRDLYGKLPLTFEANHGQTDARVKFLSHTGGYTLFLTGDEAVLALRGNHVKSSKASSGDGKLRSGMVASIDGLTPAPTAETATASVLRMKLRNANPAAKVTGADELTGASNYFIGNDPAKWRANVPTFAKVKYEGIYSGIDLVYYGNQRQLEYDFIVAPGADPRSIAFDVRGARRMTLDAHGNLVLKMSEGEIRWHKPVVYQVRNGTRQEIAAHYAINGRHCVGFEVAAYDLGRPLFVDPMIYSTFLGGSSADQGRGIAVDSSGNAYVVGLTSSTNFPTMNALQPANSGGSVDAFVAKLNPAGSALVYSTYLGGSGEDFANGIAVDSSDNVYMTGNTASTDFPVKNPLQPGNGGGQFDAFVTKLNSTGSALVYSTYLGGSAYDGGNAIAVDPSGDAYITGGSSSTDFPVVNALQPYGGNEDAFMAKLNPAGSALVYSTYLGGNSYDFGYGIAVDSVGNAYVSGWTESTNFPVTSGAFQTIYGGGGTDAFVSKLNSAGSALIYSTYLGGNNYDFSSAIAVDSSGNAYVTGSTASTNFPTKNPLQPAYGGNNDAFVTKLNSAGSGLVYSTYLGGSDYDIAYGIALNGSGDSYVTGETKSLNSPQESPVQKRKGPYDAFVSKLNSAGSTLFSSTYLGGNWNDWGAGIAGDSSGNAYVTGTTYSGNFPTKNPLQGTYGGSVDAFLSKLPMLTATTATLTSSPNPSIYGQTVTFTVAVTSNLGPPPDGETITFTKYSKVVGTGTLSGGSANFTTSTLNVGTSPVKAVYGGDANFDTSTSNTVSQAVDKAGTTTTLVSSPNPSSFGQSVTFTANVAPQFSGKVTGTVTFYDGTTSLKTASLSGGTAKFTTSTLTSGKHSITATYNGSTNFNSSSASLTQTVN